jgi:hypothetical protein
MNPSFMRSERRDWLTEGICDTEYKQFMLLAWLQEIRSEFKETRLYPALGEVINEHQRIIALERRKQEMAASLKGELTGLDLKSLQLTYDHSGKRTAIDEHLAELVEFAKPLLGEAFDEGKRIFDFVEDHLEFEPIGIVPLYKDEGYLFIYLEADREVLSFRYLRSPIELNNEKHHQLSFELVDRREKKLSETFAHLKLSLAKRFSSLPNPATWLVKTKPAFPLQETLLPVARRRLLREIAF